MAAVLPDDNGQPTLLKLNRVGCFKMKAIDDLAKANLAPPTAVTGDGPADFASTADAGCVHVSLVADEFEPRDLQEFKRGNKVLGQLKSILYGAFHWLKFRKCAAHFLAPFALRLKRRFDLRDLVARLIVDVARRKPAKEAVVRAHAEAPCRSSALWHTLVHEAPIF